MNIGIRKFALGSIAALAIAGGTLQSCRPRERVVIEEAVDRYSANGDKLIIRLKEAVDSCSENNEKLKSNSEKTVDSISANKEKQKSNFEKAVDSISVKKKKQKSQFEEAVDRHPERIGRMMVRFAQGYRYVFSIIDFDYYFEYEGIYNKMSSAGFTDDELIEGGNQVAYVSRKNEVLDSIDFVNNPTAENYNRYVRSQKNVKIAQKLQDAFKKDKEIHIRDKARQDSLAKVHEAKIKAYAEELKNKSKK